MLLRLVLLSAALAACARPQAPPPAEPPPAEPPPPERPPRDLSASARTHRARRATAAGVARTTRAGDLVTFRFEGTDGDVVAFEVDLAHPDVLAGLLRVREASSGALPLTEAGLAWRTADGATVLSPRELATRAPATRTEATLDPATGVLELAYTDTFERRPGKKRYTLWLEGGALRVRLRADPTVSRAFRGHYAGVQVGPSAGLHDARRVVVPYATSVPVVRFRDQAGRGRALSVFADWYASSGAEVAALPEAPTQRGASADGTTFSLFFAPVPAQADDGDTLAPIDETLSIAVAARVLDVLPEPVHAPSPYRRALAGRLLVHFADQGPGSYAGIEHTLTWLERSGVDRLAGYLYGWQRYGFNLLDPSLSPPGPMGCDGDVLAAASTALSPPRPYVVGGQTLTTSALLDPELPSLRDCGRARLGPVFRRLDLAGQLFALYLDAGHLDPHGFDGRAYPTATPLSDPAWGPYGLLLPPKNPGFTRDLSLQVVRDATGAPMPGWDTRQNLAGTSWSGSGHATYPISPTHRAAYYEDALRAELGPGGLGPRAAFVDAAAAEVPSWNQIDRLAGSPRAHTIAAALTAQQDAVRALRARVQGPLFGEGAYAARAQWESFESGLWDGRARGMALPDELTGAIGPWLGGPVIPDYELTAVLPRATGHHGMGWEEHFGSEGGPVTFPVDVCPTSAGCDRDGRFLDAWWAHEVTFGHMPAVRLNGWAANEYRSLEGVLREAYLVGAVHEAIAAAPVARVGYVGADGRERSLEEALDDGAVDLTQPRLHVRYAGGLEVYVNHARAAGTWRVPLPADPAYPFTALELPRHGFVAADGAGLLVFSALNPDPSAAASPARVDYAHVPGRFTMLCGRGLAQQVAGFPDPQTRAALSAAPDPAGCRATGGGDPGGPGSWVAVQVGAPAEFSRLEVTHEVDRLPVGFATSLGAVARAADGAWLDVTTRVTWLSSDPAVASVDRSGALRALAPGRVEVRATLQQEGGAPLTAPAVVLEVRAP